MTVKEFKELVLEAEKKGEINENSEVFVLNEDEGVMSEPALFTGFNRNLISKVFISKWSFNSRLSPKNRKFWID